MKPDQEIDPVAHWSQSQENLSNMVAKLTPFQMSLHNNLMNSAKTLKTSLLRTAFYLATIKKQKIHRQLGFRSIADYAQASVGFTPKMTAELLRMAGKLPDFPLVAQALRENKLTWNQAREICGRTDPKDQEIWLEAATHLPREALREAMAEARRTADPPPGNPDTPKVKTEPPQPPVLSTVSPESPVEQWHYLTFKFTSEQKARWEALQEPIRKARSINKEDLLLEALNTLAFKAGPSAGAGQPPYLVILLECPACGVAAIPTNRGEAPADAALLKAAYCDAMVEEADGSRRQVIPPRLRRLALRNARYTCQAHRCGKTQFLEIHHRTPTAMGGTHLIENLVVLCWRCHRALHQADAAAKQASKMAP